MHVFASRPTAFLAAAITKAHSQTVVTAALYTADMPRPVLRSGSGRHAAAIAFRVFLAVLSSLLIRPALAQAGPHRDT
jgi:hypothetical protein